MALAVARLSGLFDRGSGMAVLEATAGVYSTSPSGVLLVQKNTHRFLPCFYDERLARLYP